VIQTARSTVAEGDRVDVEFRRRRRDAQPFCSRRRHRAVDLIALRRHGHGSWSAGPGPKIRFTYKNKSNQRRHWGHRQHYTTIEITAISKG
jgi:hypothetical protein